MLYAVAISFASAASVKFLMAAEASLFIPPMVSPPGMAATIFQIRV
uniref:Secreted protein n=1 Tax=Magnetospirillum gryphiswaldense TaxID=55518 RepID=A4U4Q2_9PROT|nr:hypothetical protein MGR_3927 [Magnetospirillum gryphiswaldense MSR-1]